MKTSNTRYVFLALVATTFLYTGCQKASSSGVRGKKGTVGAANPLNQSEQKLDELIKEGKSIQTCTKGIQEKNTALKTELQGTLKVIADGKVKEMTEEVKKSIELHSSQIKALVASIYTEFLHEDISSCGSGKDLISVEATQSSANEIYISIADAIGKDTPESLAARQKKKDKQPAKSTETLIGKKLKPTKELLEVLDEQNQLNSLFVVDGKIASTKENYDKVLATEDLGVCLLEKAPTEKLKEDAILNVLKAELTATEISTEVPDKDAVVKKTFQLMVQLSSADQMLSLRCRLGKDLKQQSVTEQFLKIFGSLLADQSSTSNLN